MTNVQHTPHDEIEHEVATLGGGCFWCLEAVYDLLRGIHQVESGYAGGHVANPTYRAVCTGTTGHAEVVQVTFDPVRSPAARYFRSSSPFMTRRRSIARATMPVRSIAP